MKKIILKNQESDTIYFSLVSSQAPIFAKRPGEGISGMVVHDISKGWILRIGGPLGSYGYRDSLKECLIEGQKRGYEFFVHGK